MATSVHQVTTINDGSVTYEVFVGGTKKWVVTVFFGRDRRHRAGGAAFKEAAKAQEAEAARLLGEASKGQS